MRGRAILWCLALLAALVAPRKTKADDTFVYAVQISADLQTNPPAISLSWVPDPYGAKSYTIYRKAKTATSWGSPIATLGGGVTNYVDGTVEIGQTYEYQIAKASDLGYPGYGYIYSGIGAPLTENRGTLILIVATNSMPDLTNELGQLETDLIGDGWQLIRHDVSSNDAPQQVRSLITNDYWADPANVTSVFLLGHVPILESGNLNYDGHYTRAMPADAYYGEMNNDWPIKANPTNGPSYLPSDVALQVGRVDMFNLPGVGAIIPWPSEEELLRNYLNKDHNWRNHLIQVPRLALMGDRRGSVDGALAMAASGYRNFQPFVGPGNIVQADIDDDAPIPQRWISMLASGSYLWAFGDGGGEPNGITYLGTNGQYNEVLSTDVVGLDAHAVFVMLFGSYFGNWDVQDDMMRSVLATPTMGLACCMSGEPHWYLQHMGLGETIGYGTKLTMNNSTLYKTASNTFTRAVYIALMGDPALRMDPITPAFGVSTLTATNSVVLSWNAGSDPVLGYNIYRSTSPTGPFSRLNDTPITGTNYVDGDLWPDTYTYMVRAVRLETTPSGSYYNASEGAFATVTVPFFINLGISTQPSGGFTLSWNSVPGYTYRVRSNASVSQPNWLDISGTIVATDFTTTWNVSSADSTSVGLYEVSSP